MIDLLKEQGHLILAYDIVKDDIGAIQDAVLEGTSEPKIDAVLLNGGQGLPQGMSPLKRSPRFSPRSCQDLAKSSAC